MLLQRKRKINDVIDYIDYMCSGHLVISLLKLTDESKDVSDGGHEDHQQIVKGQYRSCNEDVSDPAEVFSCETQRDDGWPNLWTQTNTCGERTKQPSIVNCILINTKELYKA